MSDPEITKGEESNLWSSASPHVLSPIAFLPLFIAERHLILSLSGRVINVDGGNKPLWQRRGERGHEMIKAASREKMTVWVFAPRHAKTQGGGGC